MVIRLFSWSADSFLVHRLVYSPLSGLSFVDLTLLLTARISLLGLLLSTSLVDHFHCQPHCWLPASAGLSLLLTLLSTASVSWAYSYQPHCWWPASAGLTLLSTSLSTNGQRDFAGIFFVIELLVDRRPALAGLTFVTLLTASIRWTCSCCRHPCQPTARISWAYFCLRHPCWPTASISWTFFL